MTERSPKDAWAATCAALLDRVAGVERHEPSGLYVDDDERRGLMNTNPIYRKLLAMLLIVPVFLSGGAVVAADKTPSGTLVIDETQVMVLVGGDVGGGTLLLDDKSYSFKTGGLKIGGLGIHKVHLVGDVYDLKDVADFPGVYFAAEAGITLARGKGGFWLKNDKGVTLHMKARAKGVALDIGVEGLEITMD
jgi:hypothetical protein